MSLHLQRDLEALKKEVLQLGNLVESAINTAILALNNREASLADRVMQYEEEINDKEVHIEEECLKILALHQPVAVDLRFIVVVLKVNNDLERIADCAVNIAERARHLEERQQFEFVVASPHSQLRGRADQTARMVGAVSQPGVSILGHRFGPGPAF